MIPLTGSSHKDKTILSGQWWPRVDEGEDDCDGRAQGRYFGGDES